MSVRSKEYSDSSLAAVVVQKCSFRFFAVGSCYKTL